MGKYKDEVLLVKEKEKLIKSSEVRIYKQNVHVTTLKKIIKDQEIELLCQTKASRVKLPLNFGSGTLNTECSNVASGGVKSVQKSVKWIFSVHFLQVYVSSMALLFFL